MLQADVAFVFCATARVAYATPHRVGCEPTIAYAVFDAKLR